MPQNLPNSPRQRACRPQCAGELARGQLGVAGIGHRGQPARVHRQRTRKGRGLRSLGAGHTIAVEIGVVLFILALLVMISAAFINQRLLVATATVGFASIAIAFFSGIAFVYTGYANNSLSYLMAVGFLVGLIIYGNFAGRAQRGDRALQTPPGLPGALPAALSQCGP